MTIVPFISHQKESENTSGERINFGVIQLKNTSLEKAIRFWTDIAGMKLRSIGNKEAAFGTDTETLVVVHESADTGFRPGYSGLYHFALHLPDRKSFAWILNRLLSKHYPISPTDHTMSESIYLTDPDGITLEFVNETPERFRKVVTDIGFGIEDASGNLRPASDWLDTNEVLKDLAENDNMELLPSGTRIGHLHFYATDVDRMNTFYKDLGFIQFNYLPQFKYADRGAGGAYQHRIAMNAWHGQNRPKAPTGHAGLFKYQLIYPDRNSLMNILASFKDYKKQENGYLLTDPSGNQVLLTHQ